MLLFSNDAAQVTDGSVSFEIPTWVHVVVMVVGRSKPDLQTAVYNLLGRKHSPIR